jgi:glycosyltransferase involved in cell wall biosynthesis
MTFGAADVTVLIPTRNRRDLVLVAIESAREQTMQAAEILVVDDGSTDGTTEAIQALEQTGTPVRVISGPEQGVGPARNAGLAACSTSLVCFLDSDDQLASDALEQGLAEWRENDTMLVFSAVQFPGPHRVLTKPTEGDAFSIAGLLGSESDFNPPWGLARVDHLQAIGGFTDELPCAVDYDLLLRLCAEGRHVRCLREPVYRYKREEGTESVSGNEARNYKARLGALDRLHAGWEALVEQHSTQFSSIRVRFLLRLCTAMRQQDSPLTHEQKRELRGYASQALKLQPLRVRVIANSLRCALVQTGGAGE